MILFWSNILLLIKIERIKITEKTKDKALEQLGLYHDINFFDDGFAELAPDTITALFAEDMVGSNTEYIGQNVSMEEVLEKLKSGEIGNGNTIASSSETDEELEIDGYKSVTFSLTGRDEQDIYYLFFKVNDCEHDVSGIKSREERDEELKLQSAYVEAQKDISAIITAEVEDLAIETAEDIKMFFPDFAIAETAEEEVVSNVPIESDTEEHDHTHE